MKRQTNPVRGFLSALLLLIGMVLVPAAVLSTWIRTTVLDTDSFVSLYQPVAGKSSFQTFIAGTVADTAAGAIKDSGALNAVGSSADQVDQFLGQFGIDLGLSGTAEEWSNEAATKVRQTVYDQTMQLVQSSTFRDVWTESLRQVHSQVIEALDGSGDGTLTVQAAPFVEMLRDDLKNQGYALATLIPIPDSGVQITIAQLQIDPRVQQAYVLLDEYGPWLPWAAGAVLLLGILLAGHRLRALSQAGFGVAILCGLLWWGAPRLGDSVVVDTMGSQNGQSLAQLFWQTAITPLQELSLLVAAGALGVGVVALLFHALASRD